jgi:hypothetical protein
MNESNGIIEIKTYNIIPTNTMIIVNPDDDSGFMQIEPYTYGIDREDRRVFTISKSSQKNLFDVYLNSYKKIWNDAQQSTNQTS